MNRVAERLLKGETFVNREPGNSMTPILKSRQPVTLTPTTWENAEIGDIVFCRVGPFHYTHMVKAKNDKQGCLIGNNHGNTNGWTKNVYGKVTEIHKMDFKG